MAGSNLRLKRTPAASVPVPPPEYLALFNDDADQEFKTKDENGVVETLKGPQGDPGPVGPAGPQGIQGVPGPPGAGMNSLQVADVDDPSTELSTQSAAADGEPLFVYEAGVNSLNETTIYRWDTQTTNPISIPFVVQGLGGKWVAHSGKYQAQPLNPVGTVDGRDVSIDGAKLDGIEPMAEVNPTAAEIKSLYESNVDTNAFEDIEKAKLATVEFNAEENQTDAEIKTQYEANPDTNAFTDADQSKLAGIEAGAEVNPTASEIKTAYESNPDTNAFTDAEQSKLSGIEAMAEVNPTAPEIKSLYESNADTNAFTDAEQSKLFGIEAGAEVNPTASEIKSLYESNPDTNAFTDSEQSKLAGIEAGAEVNPTAAEIKTLYESNADTNAFTDAEQSKLAGIEAGAQVNDPLSDASPAELSDSTPAAGISNEASRSDHVHAHGNRGGGTLHAAATTSVAGFMSAADKTKLDGVEPGADATVLSNTAPVDVTKAAASAGVSGEVARQDHKHDISTAAPVSVGSANSEGAATSLARSDHVHNHGDQAGGTLHAAATTSVAGFMSAADKTNLNGLLDPIADSRMFDDFITGNEDTDELGSYGWRTMTSGAGSLVQRLTPTAAGRPGVIRIQAGNQNGRFASMFLGESGFQTIFPSGTIEFWALVNVGGALANFTNFVAGLTDNPSASGASANRIAFEVATADTNWHLITTSASTTTRTNLGVAFAASTWFKLKWTLSGGSVQANINGSDVGSAVSTNVPSVAISPTFKTDGLTAGVNTPIDIDLFQLRMSGLTR